MAERCRSRVSRSEAEEGGALGLARVPGASDRLQGSHHGSSDRPESPEEGGVGMLFEVGRSDQRAGCGAGTRAERQVKNSGALALRVLSAWFDRMRLGEAVVWGVRPGKSDGGGFP